MTRIYQGTLDAEVVRSVTLFDFGNHYCKWVEGTVDKKDKTLKPAKSKTLEIKSGTKDYVIDCDTNGHHKISFLPVDRSTQFKKLASLKAIVRIPSQCSGDCNNSPRTCAIGNIPQCVNGFLQCIPAAAIVTPLSVPPKPKPHKKKPAKKKTAIRGVKSNKSKAKKKVRTARGRK